jgi:hypothetical protein
MATQTSHLRRGVLASLSASVLASGFALAALGGAAAGAAPLVTHTPRIPVPHHLLNTWAASNWSGYAETGRYTGVSGTWTVPSVSASASPTYSSAWIGVDGFSNSSLIQTGTEEDYYSGAPHYYAWWEILPAAETLISTSAYPVSPGDRMSASIYETGVTSATRNFHRSSTQHLWSINISDTTKGWNFSTNQGYSGPGTSAEWITEAPQVGGRIATLAQYTFNPPNGVGDFDNAGTLSTVVSIGSPTYTPAGLNYANDSGVMIQNGAQVSTPGHPDGALTAFNAAYGSAVPPTPAG